MDDGPWNTIGIVAAFFALGLIVLALPIVLFNRPKFLVVPWLRHQPGAIAEWRGRTVRRPTTSDR